MKIIIKFRRYIKHLNAALDRLKSRGQHIRGTGSFCKRIAFNILNRTGLHSKSLTDEELLLPVNVMQVYNILK